jgi:dihydropteroate synthase
MMAECVGQHVLAEKWTRPRLCSSPVGVARRRFLALEARCPHWSRYRRTRFAGKFDGMATCNQDLPERFGKRATQWRLRTLTLELGRRPLLMGIVNVTPDSFSDGGRCADPQLAVEHALQLAADGADLLDIGGESTRPYAAPINADEELARVLPVVSVLAAQTRVPLSIDTSKASVAAAALDAGAEIINDVTGLCGDPGMIPLAAGTQAGVCIMHMQGTPQTMQDNPHYEQLVPEISEFLAARRDMLLDAGIARERICLDPGIGFGKTHQHNLELMASCWRFHELGCPLLVGHSRKGFLATLLGDPQTDRDAATAGCALALALQGVQVIRVHNVRLVREALLAFEAAGGFGGRGAS